MVSACFVSLSGPMENDMKVGSDDNMSGKGTMVYLDESRYVGNFENNLRSGYGELFSTLGGALKGFYRNDQPEGYGVRLTIEDEVILEYW